MKVLIYGYGWSGKSALALCENIGFECFVVDDSIDIEFTNDRTFITQKEALVIIFDIVLVCTTNKVYVDEIVAKLKSFYSIDRIRNFNSFIFKEKMSFLIKEYFRTPEYVLGEWLKDDFELKALQNKLRDLELEYYRHKRYNAEKNLDWIERINAKFPTLTIFSKIYKSAFRAIDKPIIYYPGFCVNVSNVDGVDENFYFRNGATVDLNSLRNRGNKKMIACFGNSALRVEYLNVNEMITEYMKECIDVEQYIVVNFGISGYTIYEQMMLYNALVYQLQPEIVISFLGTDWLSGFVDCKEMVEKHKMIYAANLHETFIKSFVVVKFLFILSSLLIFNPTIKILVSERLIFLF